MQIKIIKTVGAFEVVRIPERRVSRTLLPRPTFETAPAELGVRRRGDSDDMAGIQGPFATLQEAMDHARGQDHHWRTYNE